MARTAFLRHRAALQAGFFILFGPAPGTRHPALGPGPGALHPARCGLGPELRRPLGDGAARRPRASHRGPGRPDPRDPHGQPDDLLRRTPTRTERAEGICACTQVQARAGMAPEADRPRADGLLAWMQGDAAPPVITARPTRATRHWASGRDLSSRQWLGPPNCNLCQQARLIRQSTEYTVCFNRDTALNGRSQPLTTQV